MEEEHPEWLPPDWEIHVRVRTTGKKDKYYINPSNGVKYNSKPEVLRYLEKIKKDQKPKVPNKTIPKQTAAENLPSGWVKEIKISRKGGKTRKVPYYIDPVSGRQFRSLQEVNRYLETNVGKAESSNKDESGLTNEELDHSKSSTVVSEEQRLNDKKEDEMPTENESMKSEGAAVENINPPEMDTNEQREKEKDSVGEHEPPEKVGTRSQNKRKKPNTGEEELQEKLATPSQNKRKKLNTGEDEQQEKAAKASKNKRKKSKSKWMNDLPRRSSKRLARVEADPPLDEAQVNTINEAIEAAGPLDETQVNTITEAKEAAGPLDETQVNTIETINNLKISTSEDSGKQKEVQSHEPDSGKQKEEQPHIPPKEDSGKQKEQTHIPPKEDSGKQKEEQTQIPPNDVSSMEKHEAVGNVTDSKKDEMTGKQLDSTLDILFTDPCIEFAIKTLTGAIPIEDLTKVNTSSVASQAPQNQTSGSSSAPSFDDIWSDPCFEFAVKTLTSEIPVENSSNFQISFEQPRSSLGAGGCNGGVAKLDPSMKDNKCL